MMNYYAKLFRGLSSILNHIIHRFLRVNQPWEWSRECQAPLDLIKKHLTSAPISTQTCLWCWLQMSQPTDLGQSSHIAGLTAQRDPSRALNSSKRNYLQIENEAVALVFGIKCMGEPWLWLQIIKPLTTTIDPKWGILTLAVVPMQRCVLFFSPHTCTKSDTGQRRHMPAWTASRWFHWNYQKNRRIWTSCRWRLQKLPELPKMTPTQQAHKYITATMGVHSKYLRGW